MIVLKLGGAALQHCLDSQVVFKSLVANYQSNFAIVHGGGPEITATAKAFGIESEFIDGQRVTDEKMLSAVIMALRGSVNSKIVLSLMAQDQKCIGMSGLDGKMFECVEENPKLGLVGKILNVHRELIDLSIQQKIAPIVAPIGYIKKGPDIKPCNVNADLAATGLAQELNANQLIFVTDTEGVLDESKSCISKLSITDTHTLIEKGIIQGGMVVKIRAALEFLEKCQGSSIRIAGGKTPEQIAKVFQNQEYGTTITA